jgi:probable DNA metabolism protein
MTPVAYDGTFEGFLSAVFGVYEYKLQDANIVPLATVNESLFGETRVIATDNAKAERVLKLLKEKLSVTGMSQVYKTFLSEISGIENNLLRYIQYVVNSKKSVENDFSHPEVLLLQQISRKVHREKHRMEAFVRFQLTGDGIFYSIIQPDFNVLPLICKHFKDRYADQRWLIYDSRRKYGLFYDLQRVEEIQMDFAIGANDTQGIAGILDQKEELYQILWQQYFSSVNIVARKNMKLHIRHMPKRYWRFLTEKMPNRLADDSA